MFNFSKSITIRIKINIVSFGDTLAIRTRVAQIVDTSNSSTTEIDPCFFLLYNYSSYLQYSVCVYYIILISYRQ